MDARWRSTARASSSVRDARQLCTSATVMNASEAPAACSRAGARWWTRVSGAVEAERGDAGEHRSGWRKRGRVSSGGFANVAFPVAVAKRQLAFQARPAGRFGGQRHAVVPTVGNDGVGRHGPECGRRRDARARESGVDDLARVASGDDAGGETGA